MWSGFRHKSGHETLLSELKNITHCNKSDTNLINNPCRQIVDENSKRFTTCIETNAF